MTDAQRKAKQRARDRALGIKEIRIRLHQDDAEQVRQLARKLNEKRGIKFYETNKKGRGLYDNS